MKALAQGGGAGLLFTPRTNHITRVLIPAAAHVRHVSTATHKDKVASHKMLIYRQKKFWKPIVDKYFPALPPIDHRNMPQHTTYLPQYEREEEVIRQPPILELEFPINFKMPRILGLFAPDRPKPLPIQAISRKGRAQGMGKRKTCRAFAWVRPGTGLWYINGKKMLMTKYFQVMSNRDCVLQPFVATESIGLWDTWLDVRGGGHHAQAEASRMALAKAISSYDHGYEAPLRMSGFFRRDIRQVERKKPGQKKARKKFQWVKR